MYETNLINIVLSKLNFEPKHINYVKKNNKIIINCHNYFINIFKNENENEVITKSLNYNQDLIFNRTTNGDSYCMPPPHFYNEIINNIDSYTRQPNLYICVQYADITIDLAKKRYKIVHCNFNIRKPTLDSKNEFSDIITNLENSNYYFRIIYDISSINEIYSDITNHIYDLTKITAVFTNDTTKLIIIEPIMPEMNNISLKIDTKPMIGNQIKIDEYNGIFI
jgi:hypothetical protein